MYRTLTQPRKVLHLSYFLAPIFAQIHLASRSARGFSLVLVQFGGHKNDVFNILWVLVFGFATLNILGLLTRRFEPNRNRINFGEALAVMVVIMSVGLLAWELLTVYKIFPIKLHP